MQRHFVEARYRLPMRRMVWLGCLWMLGLALLMLLAAILGPVIDTPGLILTATMALLQLGCMALARCGLWGWMLRSFVWGNWLLAILFVGHAGGLYTPAVIALPVWLVVTIWAQGTRAALSMLGASLAALALSWWQLGVMPVAAERQATASLMAMIYVPGMMVLGLLVSLQARLSLGRRLQK